MTPKTKSTQEMPRASVDISANRAARKWTRREQAGRVLWTLTSPFFRFSPRTFWGWRRWLLRRFGATVERQVHITPSVRITIPWNIELGESCSLGEGAILYALGTVTIGRRATISQGAHICAGTHDWRSPDMALVKLPVAIGDDAWICADAFVGPGVTVGNGAILGARGVAVRDIPPMTIFGGNPARQIGTRDT